MKILPFVLAVILLASTANAQTTLYSNSTTGNVGIGTTSPVAGGGLTIAPAAITTGSPSLLTITGPADTTLTASTEAPDVNFNLARTVQFATGTIANQRAMRIQAPTYSFVGASTITNAATLDISGPPVAGTNATITNNAALVVESGNVGIGITSPGATLDVQSNNGTAQGNFYKTSGGSDSYMRFNMGNAVSTNYWQFAVNPNNTAASSIFNIYTSSSGGNVMSLLGNGNVGIGTTSPATTLDVNGEAHFTSYQVGSINSGSSVGNFNATAAIRTGTNANILFTPSEHASSGTAIFSLNDGGSSAVPIEILGSTTILGMNGNVGIGNTSPSYSLDVTGSIRTTQALLNSSAVPTISSCGTTPPAATAGSNNNSGQFTLGTGATAACTVTFANAFPNQAYCTVAPASSYTGTYYISAQSNSAFTVTLGTGTASVKFNYTCGGN